MSTELASRPASVMRTYTQQVRDASAAMARLTDQYFATLKRAEAQYFQGIKRITDGYTKSDEPANDTPTAETAPQTQ
jgi:hypothetical protein